jgi:hypothetical protein
MLGILELVISSGQKVEFESYDELYNITVNIYHGIPDNSIRAWEIGYFLMMPINLVWTLLMFVQSIVKGRTVDILISLAIAMSIRSFFVKSEYQNDAISGVCIGLSLLMACVRIFNEPSANLAKLPTISDENLYEESLNSFNESLNTAVS